MTSRRARVDALTEDVSTLSETVTRLYEELEAAVDAAEAADTDTDGPATAAADATEAENADETRADGGNVGWEEIETAGPDGEKETESVDWTPVETE